MPRIRILPLGVEIDALLGSTVMGSARANGYYWPTTCGGEGRCTTCACEVVEGIGLLAVMGRAERQSLVYERGEGVLTQPVRLACQARFAGPEGMIVVRKPGVRPPEDRAI